MTSDNNIKETLKANSIVMAVIPDMKYEEGLTRLAGILGEDYKKILYISINKPYEKLVGKFKQNNINPDKFYFIDCITKTVENVSPNKNCTYVSSPRALNEIKVSIIEVLKKQKIDVALIDSPSSLSSYYEHMDVLKFIHLFMVDIITTNSKCVFPFQKEGAGPIRRSIRMFTDKTVYLEPDERGSSNVNYTPNIVLMLDEMLLCFRIVAWNIQLRLAGIKNKAGIFS